jgi:hypothetical protein
VNLNIPDVIVHLGQAGAVAASEGDRKDVPGVIPVMRDAVHSQSAIISFRTEIR